MEGSNHIKSLGAVYHLGRLYLNLKDQGVQYDVLVSNGTTNKKKAQTYLFKTNKQFILVKIKNHINLIHFKLMIILFIGTNNYLIIKIYKQ